jgi:type I restriction enzyme S subunit
MTRRVKLKEVCREITVGHVGPMANEYVESGIPFLRSQNISPFRLEDASIKFISNDFHKRLKKSALAPGDVVVVRTGYPGTACVVPKRFPVANCADLVILRPSTEIDGYFLCCLFNSVWGQRTVAGSLVGVAQQHFNIGVAKEMEINLPPLPVQKNIASILSAYDDQIENNIRRIKILGEVAQMIYREWFVNFRFPGHEKVKVVDSGIGAIPHGWRVGALQDAVVLQRGFDLPTAQRQPGTVPILAATGINGTHSVAKVKGPGVVTGRSGSLGVVLLVLDDFWPLNTTLWVKEFRQSTPAHAYFTLNNLKLSGFNSGAAVPTLNRNDIQNLPLILPETKVLDAFDDCVMPLFRLQNNLKATNANLRQTRDLLLPKLMSGEISVEHVETEAVAQGV